MDPTILLEKFKTATGTLHELGRQIDALRDRRTPTDAEAIQLAELEGHRKAAQHALDQLAATPTAVAEMGVVSATASATSTSAVAPLQVDAATLVAISIDKVAEAFTAAASKASSQDD